MTGLVWLQIPKAINTYNNHSFLPLTTTFCYKHRLFIKKKVPLFIKPTLYQFIKHTPTSNISLIERKGKERKGKEGNNRDPCYIISIRPSVHSQIMITRMTLWRSMGWVSRSQFAIFHPPPPPLVCNRYKKALRDDLLDHHLLLVNYLQ